MLILLILHFLKYKVLFEIEVTRRLFVHRWVWKHDAKNWLLGKDPDAGKDWRQEEKGMTEYEMVEWHHWLNGHEFEHAAVVGDGRGSLACCSPWDHNMSDMTEQLNWTEAARGMVCRMAPQPGIEPGPLQWKHWILTTRPPVHVC